MNLTICKAPDASSGDELAEPRVALITGCSIGIGRATATALALARYRVVATARRAEKLAELDVAMALSLDVANASSIDTASDKILRRYGKIDVLVNNAGYALPGALEELDVKAVRGHVRHECPGHCPDGSLLGLRQDHPGAPGLLL